MKTDTNVHEQVDAMIAGILPARAVPGRKPKVLDLGCGEGALSQRLYDQGYDVLAVDADETRFMAQGPAFLASDLNDPGTVDVLADACGRDPDLILAVEVIEHLQSPWHFLAACRRLSSNRTQLIVTTPNVGSWWSRLWFLLTGEPWGFSPESWTDPGHIHPLTETEMRGLLSANGFACKSVSLAGNLPIIWAYNWKRLLASLLMLPLRPLMRGEKDGWVLCYHATVAS